MEPYGLFTGNMAGSSVFNEIRSAHLPGVMVPVRSISP